MGERFRRVWRSSHVLSGVETMRRIGVNSSSITSIGYDSQRRELEIEFRSSGDVYRYFDVPMEEFNEFLAAESKGTDSESGLRCILIHLFWSEGDGGERGSLLPFGKMGLRVRFKRLPLKSVGKQSIDRDASGESHHAHHSVRRDYRSKRPVLAGCTECC